MKVRVTLMTENDKHVDETVTKEHIEAVAKKGWRWLAAFQLLGADGDKVTVENVELVER